MLYVKACEELGVSVFVHPWDMELGGRMKQYWLPWLVGMPSETTAAICCMIFGGVLERFPKLKVCFAHGCGAFPYTLGRIEHGFNTRPDLCATNNTVNPRSYIGQIYSDSLVHDAKSLKLLIDVIGQVWFVCPDESAKNCQV
jgi:aminocarboxymuconate-semialdehyde decarboxylase